MFRAVADVQRFVVAVEIQAVEGSVGDNPLRDFQHVFVGDDEITGSTLAFADQVATGIHFMGGVLVAFGVDTALDVFGDFGGAEAVGELDAAEIIHHRVNDVQGEGS